MKQLTNTILPVEIGMELERVRRIRFKFAQKGTEPIFFKWPSEAVSRKPDSNVLLLRWTKEQTAHFSTARQVSMDTLIELEDSGENPATPILHFNICPTLFTSEEVAGDA